MLKKRNISVLPLILIILFCFNCEKGPALKELSVINVGVSRISGLAYNPVTNTLFTVQDDANGKIYELTLSGEVKKEIKVASNDMEGITLDIKNNIIYAAEEGLHEIIKYSYDGKKISSLKINYKRKSKKKGLEGIALDTVNNKIYAANEKKPKVILELDFTGKVLNKTKIDFADDISGLFFNEKTGHLWVVSHESKRIFVLDKNKKVLNKFSIPVIQAEGIAIDSEGYIYVVCEQTSNLYKFKVE